MTKNDQGGTCVRSGPAESRLEQGNQTAHPVGSPANDRESLNFLGVLRRIEPEAKRSTRPSSQRDFVPACLFTDVIDD